MSQSPKTNDEITEEEFDALLDDLQAGKAVGTAAAPARVEVHAAAGSDADDGLISEDEFDDLLDQLDRKRAEVSAEPPAETGSSVTESAAVAGPAGFEFRLAGQVGIAEVEVLHARLAAWDAADRDVHFDAGEVDRVDTAVLQLLVAFKRHAEQRGADVRWRAVSAPVTEAAATLGLETALGLDPAPRADA